MITFRHENYFAVMRNDDFVEAQVGGVNALDSIALGAIEFVEINFFEVCLDHLAGGIHAMHVVFVWGIRTPISGGSINFDGNQTMAIEAGREKGIDLSSGIAAATDFNGDVIGRNKPRGMFTFGLAPAIG